MVASPLPCQGEGGGWGQLSLPREGWGGAAIPPPEGICRSPMNQSDPPRIFNRPEYKQRRQKLRTNMTEPEKRLWQILRNEQMGVKFRRQHGIGYYIADFYCVELQIVIEVDGESHSSDEAQAYDRARDGFMSSLGIFTLRIKNEDVMNNIDGVYQQIKLYLDSRDRGQRQDQRTIP